MSENVPAKRNIIVYACSGCSDAGESADRIARQLTREGAAQMSCLAGIGGRVRSLVLKAEKAERILVVDGCPLNCAAHTLKLAGFLNFDHLELHEIGFRKGSCPVTEDKIATGVEAAKEILAGGTGLRPVVSGVVPETGAARTVAPQLSVTLQPISRDKIRRDAGFNGRDARATHSLLDT